MPAPAPPSDSVAGAVAPVRRMVGILQSKIETLEKRRQAKGKENGDDPAPLLEFAWDLIKQATGIAILAENEAKKRERKDRALRRAQDRRLVHAALQLVECSRRLADPRAREDALAGRGGAPRVDPRHLDALCAVCAPNLDDFESNTLETARRAFAALHDEDGHEGLNDVVAAVRDSGYLDRPREPEPEPAPEEEDEPPRPPSPPTPVPEEPEPAPMPPPAPMAVPAPSFAAPAPLLPLAPLAPLAAHAPPAPVTLQQIELAYFAQYGRRPPPPPAPEVIGPQSFIFLQDSELDQADAARRTPAPGAPPSAIPSQTFTNQTFAAPAPFPVEAAAEPPAAPAVQAAPPTATHPVRQQRPPSPFRQGAPRAPAAPRPPAGPEPREPDALEIDEWNPRPNGDDRPDARRPRGRGGRPGGHRGRGHPNGRPNGHHRNGEAHEGRPHDGDDRRERGDGEDGPRGRGTNPRGPHRQNGGPRGGPRGGNQTRGGPRPGYNIRKTTNGNHFESRNGGVEVKQSFSN